MINITTSLVKQLIYEQFPHWRSLEVKPVKKSGHDNRTFHLGNDMSVRLPSGKDYAPQIEKEITWLPYLQSHLSFPIPSLIAIGKATKEYPYPWSINKWILGDTLQATLLHDKERLAKDLALYLKELQAIDTMNGPIAGAHNFYRGGSLAVYHEETIHALRVLKDEVPVNQLKEIWEEALSSSWKKDKVWVHGDIAPGNLLIKDDVLYAIIDFGILGVGDPACDYAMAWTYFDTKSRDIFHTYSGMDKDTQNRAKGWALWKALITYEKEESKQTIQAILND